jgi:predicted RNA-binding protein with RPS1 domain
VGDWDIAYTRSIAEEAKEGDLVDVQVVEATPDGKLRVSRKAVLLEDAKNAGPGSTPSAAAASSEAGSEGGDNKENEAPEAAAAAAAAAVPSEE